MKCKLINSKNTTSKMKGIAYEMHALSKNDMVRVKSLKV